MGGSVKILTDLERFMLKVEIEPITKCWLWTASKNPEGYGWFGYGDHYSKLAHRWIWEYFNGPIPKGIQLDHKCRVRRCVNYIDHLEPVTNRENVLRSLPFLKRECKRGHKLELVGKRWRCRQCKNRHERKYYWQKKTVRCG